MQSYFALLNYTHQRMNTLIGPLYLPSQFLLKNPKMNTYLYWHTKDIMES